MFIVFYPTRRYDSNHGLHGPCHTNPRCCLALCICNPSFWLSIEWFNLFSFTDMFVSFTLSINRYSIKNLFNLLHFIYFLATPTGSQQRASEKKTLFINTCLPSSSSNGKYNASDKNGIDGDACCARREAKSFSTPCLALEMKTLQFDLKTFSNNVGARGSYIDHSIDVTQFVLSAARRSFKYSSSDCSARIRKSTFQRDLRCRSLPLGDALDGETLVNKHSAQPAYPATAAMYGFEANMVEWN